MFAIEARDFAGSFAIARSLFQVRTFIARRFSLSNGDLRFQFAVFPMQIEKDEGASADLGFTIKLIDFGAMEQKFAHSFGGGDLVTGAFVGLDVRIIEEGFTVLDASEGIVNVGLSRPDRFYLAALELEPGFVTLEDMKISQRFAVENRLGSH